MLLLLARFGIQKKLLEKSDSNFSRFQRIFAGSTALLVFILSLVVVWIIIFGFTFLYQDNFYSMELRNFSECNLNVDIVNIVLDSIYFVGFVITAVLAYSAKVTENLGIRTEMVIIIILGTFFTIVHIGIQYVSSTGKIPETF